MDNLIKLIKNHYVKTGDFVLASGKRSKYYIDCKKLLLDPIGLGLVSELVLEKLKDLKCDAVGGEGLVIGSLVGVCVNRGYYGFLIRKNIKDHGTGNAIEGRLEPWHNAVVLEDVATTGDSLSRAVEATRRFGAKVVMAMSIVDRGAKVDGIPYFSFLSSKDIVEDA